MRHWSSEKWTNVGLGWKLVPQPGTEPSPPVSFQCLAQLVWKVFRLFVGNIMHPREQKEFTFLLYARVCLLCMVFGSLCSSWGPPVCQALCYGLSGGQCILCPGWARFLKRHILTLYGAGGWGSKEHLCTSLGWLRPSSLHPTKRLLKYLHFHLCSGIYATASVRYPDSPHALALKIFPCLFLVSLL